MKIIVNSIVWNIIFVPSNSKELLRSDNVLTLGVTDRNVNCVFLSNQLHGELLYKVLCHELCHVYIFSYGIYFLMEEEERLAEFGVARLRSATAISLSGGERRRVELARALAASPDFILLDEPFTGIDPIAIGEIKDNIRKLSEEKGLGVLITDHNPKATLSITDRAYVIFDGKIKIQGKSEEVAVNPVAKEFYLGKDFQL